MRTITMFNRVSVDGFYAAADGSIDWFIPDPHVDRAVHETGGKPYTVLFGRVTYQLFESHWPKAAADPDAPEQARKLGKELTEMPKVVFSRTLNKVGWANSELVKGDLVQEVKRRKQEDGPDIIIFGSGTIVQQLADEGLIDEYLIVLTPVVLGAGKLLFRDVRRFNLQLVEATGFDSGNVLLHYRLDKTK
jgi:dihydrofolate reductase